VQDLKKALVLFSKRTLELQNLDISRGLKPRGKILLKSPVIVAKKISKNMPRSFKSCEIDLVVSKQRAFK
jgi:hypothetical protein